MIEVSRLLSAQLLADVKRMAGEPADEPPEGT